NQISFSFSFGRNIVSMIIKNVDNFTMNDAPTLASSRRRAMATNRLLRALFVERKTLKEIRRLIQRQHRGSWSSGVGTNIRYDCVDQRTQSVSRSSRKGRERRQHETAPGHQVAASRSCTTTIVPDCTTSTRMDNFLNLLPDEQKQLGS
ncbi:unnamed protein product, partial [Amoebophrya sp. A120]